MKTLQKSVSQKVKMQLVEVGGRMSQDIGMGRIVGQALVYLYLTDRDSSLDQMEEDLGLSKAAVSIAARQLESFGLIKRVWKRGDRKNYYKTADNIALALQQGMAVFLKQKMQSLNMEIDSAMTALSKEVTKDDTNRDVEFLYGRLKRASQLRDKFQGIIESPLVDFFIKS